MNKNDLIELMKRLIAQELKVSINEVDIHAEFFDLGLDSISAMYLIEKLENELKITISPLDFWDYPTVDKLSEHITHKYL